VVPSSSGYTAHKLAGLAKAVPSLPLGKLCGWALLLIGISYWGNVLRASSHGATANAGWLLNSVLYNGAFNIAAWVLIAVRAGKIVAPTVIATRLQIAFLMAIALVCVVPKTQATVGPLLILAVMLARSSRTRDGHVVAILLFGIAVELIGGAFYMLSLHLIVAKLDAQVVVALLSFAGQNVQAYGNVVDNVSAQHGIEVLAPCASSFPLAQLGLAYLVTKIYFGHLPGRGDLPWFAAAVVASVVLTELRLSLLALSGPSYVWWHDGDGTTVYIFSQLAISVLFPILAALKLKAAPLSLAFPARY
jgi:hypothetical protein